MAHTHCAGKYEYVLASICKCTLWSCTLTEWLMMPTKARLELHLEAVDHVDCWRLYQALTVRLDVESLATSAVEWHTAAATGMQGAAVCHRHYAL
jgi:hypothetical protein